MANLNWYWRRLRAMGPVEVALRLRKKWFEFKDAKRDQWPSADLSPSSAFPKLPEPASAPEPLRESLKRDASASSAISTYRQTRRRTGSATTSPESMSPPGCPRSRSTTASCRTAGRSSHSGSQAVGMGRCAWRRPVGCSATAAAGSTASTGLRTGWRTTHRTPVGTGRAHLRAACDSSHSRGSTHS